MEGTMRVNLASLLIIGFALFSASAWGQAPCDVGTLKGQFVFTGRGFIEAVQPGIERMHYGVFVFDGSYTLDPDCTGTLTLGGILAGQTHWDLYVTEDRKRGHIIRMDEGNMAVRSFER